MNLFEIPVGDPETNSKETTPKPVDVFVYRDRADTWCLLKRDPEIERYLIQVIKAVPTDRKKGFLTDREGDIEVGDEFFMDDPTLPCMVRVEYFEDPAPKFAIVIEGGMVRNAYSLTGDSDFAYAIIDLDGPECDENGNDITPIAVTYVVDGIADSVEDIISGL
jgi:hypothetical protein